MLFYFSFISVYSLSLGVHCLHQHLFGNTFPCTWYSSACPAWSRCYERCSPSWPSRMFWNQRGILEADTMHLHCLPYLASCPRSQIAGYWRDWLGMTVVLVGKMSCNNNRQTHKRMQTHRLEETNALSWAEKTFAFWIFVHILRCVH